ncbi:MAG: diguanylate cyclase [Chloroflexota bacterium]|nr:diguanylate cyclase [Chloroflexota bacterium]
MPERQSELAEGVLQELCEAVGAHSGALFLPDGDGALVLAATAGRASAGGTGPLGRILRRDIRESDEQRRTLIIPVPDDDGGLIVLERAGRDDFTADDRALARVYARQLAAKVSGAVAGAGAAWARDLEVIHEIASQLNRLGRLEDVGAALCARTRQVVEYEEARLLVSADHPQAPLTLVALDGAPTGRRGEIMPLAEDGPVSAAIAHCRATGSPLILPDIAAPGPGRIGSWSALIVPLRSEHRVTGVFCLLAARPLAFDEGDLRLLRLLCDQAAVAVENARAIEAREELVEELHALLEISRAASEASDELALAGTLAVKMRIASRMDACVISRWQPDSTMLSTLAMDGIEGSPPLTDIADFPATWAVLRSAEPRVVQSDAVDDALPEARALAEMGGRTLLMLPLTVGGRAIGLIELISLTTPRYFGADEMKVYETMAGSAAAGLENVRLLEQLRHAADVDQVTGVNNHRYLQDRLRQEIARAARGRTALSVLMLDLDYFKPINDRFGHADGDRVLRNVANTIKAHVRANDIVARYGGDEFVVVMPETPAGAAQEVARRVIVGIRERGHELSDGSVVKVGVSGGLALYPDNGRTAALLLQAADGAMYTSKRARQAKPESAQAPPGALPSSRETLLLQTPLAAPAAG